MNDLRYADLVLIRQRLIRLYTPPACAGGHDVTHIQGMLALEQKIGARLKFDSMEYKVAVWLHNLDRVRPEPPLSEYLDMLGHFSQESKARIERAVREHSKRDDEPQDSTLLVALRIADKLDRLSARGLLSVAAFQCDKITFDPAGQLGYRSTRPEEIATQYDGLFHVLEWYKMLPADWARELVDRCALQFYINFLHQFSKEISAITGQENTVDCDIQRALGPYYDDIMTPALGPW